VAVLGLDVNRCTANVADSLSLASILGVPGDSFLGQALTGNDFSTVSNIATGQSRWRAVGSVAVSNPTPANATAIIVNTKCGLGWDLRELSISVTMAQVIGLQRPISAISL
jgi:hypothetical protein